MNELQRHQAILSIMKQHSENVANGAVGLWRQMAAKLISVIGEVAFDALYARSIVRTQSTFPWLVGGLSPSQTDRQFLALRTSLNGQVPAQASGANSLLLIAFTDLLASFIGEDLTSSIICSVWRFDELDAARKEFKNE